MAIEILTNPTAEVIERLGNIMRKGFRSKVEHVGMSTEDSMKFFDVSIQDLMKDEHVVVAVAVDDDSGEIQGVSELCLPLQNAELQARKKSSHQSHHLMEFFNNLPLVRRLRAKKLLLVVSDPYATLNEGEGYVKLLAVDIELTGKGIGKKLLDWADEHVKSKGGNAISLHVACNNPAERLYQRHGYNYEAKRSTDDWIGRTVCSAFVGAPGFKFYKKDLNQDLDSAFIP